MEPTDLAFAGAQRQIELLQAREVSALELVEIYLERIERLDPALNAYRVVFADRARAEARQADGRRGAGEDRPLLGIPVAIKDDADIAGEITCWGTNAIETPATADAEVVRRLRAAGAVILGKTHVPELTIHGFTESPTFGVTRNPWDLQRSPGGSSGGSAAAVAAGLCSVALGSDGAGSIRIPSAACGLFGLKPQMGRVPAAPKRDPWHGLSTYGAIARRVADSARFYDAVREGGESFADAAAREPGRLRVAVSEAVPPMSGVRIEAEQRGAVRGTADLLRDLGHEVLERDVDYPPSATTNTSARYLRGIHDDARAVEHPERLSRQTRGYMRLGGLIPAAQVERARAAAEADGARMNSVFAEADVLVTPIISHRPPPIGHYEGRSALRTFISELLFVPWTAQYNHTGQPAAAVPAGFAGDGFPLSVQLVAPPGREDLLLSVAAQLERARGWPDHVPPMAA
jgi:amidase